MNKTIVLISSALLSLIVGYHLYPVVNEPRLDKSSSHSADLSMHPNKKLLAGQNSMRHRQSENKVKTLAISEQSSSDKSSDDDLNEMRKPATNSTAQTTDYYLEDTYVESSEQLAELQIWSESHKENLKEIINNNLPAERAQDFLEYMMKDNPFLNEATVNQDVNSDEEWSYKMTEIINNLILQHPYGNDIEVLSLTCKQLTCEMIVRQLVNGSWFEVYTALITHFLSNQYIIQTKDMKQFRFKNVEEHLFYQQLIFTK